MQRDPIGAGATRNRPPLPLLTTLRFFAAAEVVAFHVVQAKTNGAIPEGFLWGLVSGGYAAVIFFFVLSGFILAYAHTGDSERTACNVKATRFWRLRFARIAPAYYLALLLALPIIAQVVAESKASGWSIAVGLASVLLFLQSWWPAYVTLWNFPAWSLSVECLFYALFPWLARALARWPVAVVFAGSYALIVLTSTQRVEFMAFARGYAPDHWLMPTIFPLLHLPLFVFGMALARLYLFSQARSSRLHAAMLGSGVILLVLIFGGTGASMLPSWLLSDAVLVPAFALVIFGGAGAAGTIPLFTRPAFILLGEASYSIYILHIPLRPWWDDFVDAIPGLSLTPWLHFLLYFGFVVLVSVVVFRRVETPMRQWIAGRDVERARPANVTPILQTSGAS